jgi:hypothetical protein
VTSEDSALLYDNVPEDYKAEVFLWKKCCLEAYAKSRVVLNADGSHAKAMRTALAGSSNLASIAGFQACITASTTAASFRLLTIIGHFNLAINCTAEFPGIWSRAALSLPTLSISTCTFVYKSLKRMCSCSLNRLGEASPSTRGARRASVRTQPTTS